MPRGASDLPDDHAEAAANLRARVHRARLLATGVMNEPAAKGLRDHADEVEAQAAALAPQVIPPDT